MATETQLSLGKIILAPTPQNGSRNLVEYQQAVSAWTRQAEQTFRQFERSLTNLNTSQIPQSPGTVINQYWSQALFDAAFTAKTTDGLAEGITNLYFTSARARASVSATSPLFFNSGTGVFTIQKADATHDGYLSQADWSTFNGKQSALTFGNLTELTSAVLTIAGGTGAVIGSGTTINVQKADTSHDGYLSQTDWNTFSGKQSALGNFPVGYVLFGQGTSIPLTDSNIFWDNAAKAFCLGTVAQAGALTVVGSAGQVGCNISGGNRGAASGTGGGLVFSTGSGGSPNAATGGAGGAIGFTCGVGGSPTTSGAGGAGGSITFTGGLGGTSLNAGGGAGGGITFYSGAGGVSARAAAPAPSGGVIAIYGGTGGTNTLAGGGGVGGAFGFLAGAGGNSSNSGPAGAGGNAAFTSGGGGQNTSTGAGGSAGAINFFSGAGGNTPAASGTPGAGGMIAFLAGDAGTSGDAVKGNVGGSITFTGGKGSGSSNGGDITFNPGAVVGTGAIGNVFLAKTRGNVSIAGIISPTARLHIAAGFSSPGTSPFKLSSGPILSVAEIGAFDFLTDDLYFTITTGSARKGFVLTDGTNLTSGRVPFAATNGRLVDSANMTWDGAYGLKSQTIYGSMGSDDISIVVANSGVAIGVEVAVGAGIASGPVNGFTFSNSVLTAQVAGKYAVRWAASLTATNDNEIVACGVMVNTTPQTFTEGSAECINGSKPVCLSGGGVVTLSIGDGVKLYTENDTAAHDTTVTHANLTLQRIDN